MIGVGVNQLDSDLNGETTSCFCEIQLAQDSMETALNSSSDVMFTATAEEMAKRKNR